MPTCSVAAPVPAPARCRLERFLQRFRVRERVVEERRSYSRRVERTRATDGVGRREHDRRLRFERLDEAVCPARRHDDDAPDDPRLVEQRAQHGRRERHELERRQHADERTVAVGRTGQVEHHDILARIDRSRDLLQRLAQVGDGRHRRVEQRRRAVEEDKRAVGRLPALVHDVLRGEHVLAKGPVARVAGKTDEIEIGFAWRLVLEVRQCIVEECRLRCEHRFRRRVRVPAVSGRRSGMPPTLRRQHRR